MALVVNRIDDGTDTPIKVGIQQGKVRLTESLSEKDAVALAFRLLAAADSSTEDIFKDVAKLKEVGDAFGTIKKLFGGA